MQYTKRLTSRVSVPHPRALPRVRSDSTFRHYKNGDFEDAVDYYTMALHYCPEDEEHKKDRAVYLANRAQGHLRLEEVGSTTPAQFVYSVALFGTIWRRQLPRKWPRKGSG